MKTIHILVTAALVLTVSTATAQAAVPQLLNYQGVLQNAVGVPITTTVNVTFAIWNDAASGDSLWSETQSVTPDASGRFNVLLGSVASIPDSAFAGNAFLGVAVSPDPELSPRTQLVSVPYAFRSATVNGASGGMITGDVSVQGDVTGSASASFGPNHTVSGINTFVAGEGNVVLGNWASVGGGIDNFAVGEYSAVGGGFENEASSDWAYVGGGIHNDAADVYATVGGGYGNFAGGDRSVIAGGYCNEASGSRSTIGGGTFDTTRGEHSTISGGNRNLVTGKNSTIGGGERNRVRANFAVIAGGGGEVNADSNLVSGIYGSILGGRRNVVSGIQSAIGGGLGNLAEGTSSTVSGGSWNRAIGDYSVVAGGGGNFFSDSNSAHGDYSAIGGGRNNSAAGHYAVIPGGQSCQAAGHHSFAVGWRAYANNDGSFVWADSSSADSFATTGTNQFLIRAAGGVGIGTDSPAEALHVIGNICATGTIATCSDKRFKRDIHDLDGALGMITQLRAVDFAWRTDEFPNYHFPKTRQVGFLAQEIMTVLPTAVSEAHDGYLSVDYGRLTPLLVEAVKEQQATIEELRARLSALETALGTGSN